ncbi:hypothetical protein GRW42_21330, partial [Escherichia coli]|nr:hypothetical protein [Escherichia coli]MXJ07443.1 hypothetical protein [Escherichia coli]
LRFSTVTPGGIVGFLIVSYRFNIPDRLAVHLSIHARPELRAHYMFRLRYSWQYGNTCQPDYRQSPPVNAREGHSELNRNLIVGSGSERLSLDISILRQTYLP